jgi:hypothetical protein
MAEAFKNYIAGIINTGTDQVTLDLGELDGFRKVGIVNKGSTTIIIAINAETDDENKGIEIEPGEPFEEYIMGSILNYVSSDSNGTFKYILLGD